MCSRLSSANGSQQRSFQRSGHMLRGQTPWYAGRTFLKAEKSFLLYFTEAADHQGILAEVYTEATRHF